MADTLRRADYVYLQEFLRSRIGHDLGEGKEYLVESRLAPLVLGRRLASIGTLLDRLRTGIDPRLVDDVIAAMVTGETQFFRGGSAFDRLRLSVFPALIAARVTSRRLRIWSAGCSTGQEPYSIALTLLEFFPEVAGWDVRILATDVSRATLDRAEAGSYTTPEVSRGLGPGRLRGHFVERDGRWTVGSAARKLVKFEVRNLLDSPPDSTEYDLIFCRNVLIYFGDEARSRVFSTFRRSIRDDGFLFLGESETILGQDVDFCFAGDGLDYYRPSPSSPNFSGQKP